jgi:N-methylhydantoinase B
MPLDIVTLEVIRNMLPAIANEMSYVLQRTSYNMMIYEVRDYCCGLLDRSGRLLAQNTGGVSHFVADLGVVIRDGVERYGPDGFRPGDVIITNHQRVGGQHLNNVLVYTPCFESGRLFGFAATRAHWMDVGGLSTGFGGANALDPWMEGLQLDQIKLYEAGQLDEKAWRLIRDNIRFPESSLGDLKSQVAACRLAEKRLEEMFARYRRPVVEQAIERIFDQTEARCRAIVEAMPDGVYEAESQFGGSPLDRNQPVEIKVRVVIKGSGMTIDLTQCSPQRRAPINARTLAAPLIAYKALTLPEEPVNEGAFRALKVEIQEGNYMMARHPAAMASWGRTLPSVVDTIFLALAPILRDKIPAAHMGVLGGPVVFFGTDPATGQRFVTQSIEGGGWGGTPTADGECATVSVCQGDVHNAPIEKMELRWPILVRRRALRPDSGGPGQYRGGLGLEIEIEGLTEGSWSLTDMGRQRYPPWGLNGGKPGMTSANLMKLPDEDSLKPVNVIRHLVPAGTVAVVATAGGGGWGDPLQRDPEKIRWDVIEGYVSLDAAKREYGVV